MDGITTRQKTKRIIDDQGTLGIGMIRRIEPDQGNNALKTVAYLQ